VVAVKNRWTDPPLEIEQNGQAPRAAE